MELKGKKVLVFGSRKKRNRSSSSFWDRLEPARFFMTETQIWTKKQYYIRLPELKKRIIYAGELPEEVTKSLDLAVLSPGVPTDLPLVKSFYEQGLPVWGEVELAFQYRERASSCNYRNKRKNHNNSPSWEDHGRMPRILYLLLEISELLILQKLWR